MKNIILRSAALASIFFIALTGWGLSDAGEREEAEQAFRQADVINDGRIDTGEFDMYHQRVFRALDADHDGILTLNECVGHCFAPQQGNGGVAPSGMIHYKFDAIDVDGNGQLAEYEYILYGRERFEDYDTNDDYLIGVDEFCTFYQASMPCTFTAATEKLVE